MADKIIDYISGIKVNGTPEEIQATQPFSKILVENYGYPKELIQTRPQYRVKVRPSDIKKEYPVDIAVFTSTDKREDDLYIIIECKKETVNARNAKDGIAQLQSYMSVCPNCEWGMWTNSIQKFVFRKITDAAGNTNFREYNDIPSANGNLDEVNRPSRLSLKNAYDDNLLFVFKTCHNHIYVNDGLQNSRHFLNYSKLFSVKSKMSVTSPTIWNSIQHLMSAPIQTGN